MIQNFVLGFHGCLWYGLTNLSWWWKSWWQQQKQFNSVCKHPVCQFTEKCRKIHPFQGTACLNNGHGQLYSTICVTFLVKSIRRHGMHVNLSKGISCTITHNYEMCRITTWKYYLVMCNLSRFLISEIISEYSQIFSFFKKKPPLSTIPVGNWKAWAGILC